MRVDDDARGLGLAEYLGEPHRRHALRADDVGEHRPRPDGRELVDVADEKQGGVLRNGPEELVREDDVHHRHLVDDHEVGVEGLVASMAEASGRRVELEQPMDGGCLEAGGLREPLRGPAVGAQRRARTPFARTMRSTALTMVVFPTPGPPVMTVTRSRMAQATASRCEPESSKPTRCSAHGTALSGSMFPQGGPPAPSRRPRWPAAPRSERCRAGR